MNRRSLFKAAAAMVPAGEVPWWWAPAPPSKIKVRFTATFDDLEAWRKVFDDLEVSVRSARERAKLRKERAGGAHS